MNKKGVHVRTNIKKAAVIERTPWSCAALYEEAQTGLFIESESAVRHGMKPTSHEMHLSSVLLPVLNIIALITCHFIITENLL